MNTSFKYLNCALLSISSFIVSVLLIINPQRFMSHSLLLIGSALAICGISAIAFFFKSKKNADRVLLYWGIPELVLGIALFALKGFLVSRFEKLNVLFAFLFILIGAIYAFKLVNNISKNGRAFTPSLCVALCLASALVVLLYPFAQWFLWRFIALSVALQGILYIYVTFGSRAFESKNERNNKES